MIPAGVILVWPGTNASIPSLWQRVTSLDGKFFKGASGTENPNVTGGANSHSHTSPSHSHTMASHSHSVGTSSAVGTNQRGNDAGSSATWIFHTHPTTLAAVTEGTINYAVTYATVDSLPPYHEVIFITPTIGFQFIPDDVIALLNSGTIPANFAFANGDGGTPDLRNKYLRGASTSQDAGTTGGSLTHSHNIDHNHATVAHGHSGTSDNSTPNDATTGGGSPVAGIHTHSMSLPDSNSATNGYTGSAGSADTVEPAYYKLLAIQNISGHKVPVPVGAIAFWLGTTGSIPNGWFLCDGTKATPDLQGKFIKIANTTGDVGGTGGSNTHTHAASNSHTHTATGTHTHGTGGSTGSFGSNVNGWPGGSANNSNIDHTHTISSVGYATATYANATVSADSTDNQPAYRTVAYIMFKYGIGGAAMFLL